jgi:hypothetical protein
MFGQIDEIKNLAFKYSKQQLGRMVQMGMIDPQKAMMAGMMRDRVAKEDTKPPTTTVAQDVLGAAPQVQQPAQPQQMGMPQQAPASQAPVQMAATGGITSLPVQEQDYAGGGIVAFADGGDTGYEYKFNPDTGGYTLIGEKKKEIPVDTRQHLGAAGLGVFGSEGMDLMTGLPKGNMRDPVLGFADGGVAHYYEGGTTSPMGRWWKGVGAATPEQQATYAAQQEQQAREQALLARQNQLGGLFGLQQQSPEQQAEYEQIQKELIANRKGLNGIAPNQTFPTSTNPNAPVTGSLDTANTTPWIDATGKATVDKPAGGTGTGTGGRPRLPALNEPTGKIDIKEYNAKPVQELDVLAKERSEAYRKAGIDPDLYKSMIEKEEGKREGLGKRKEEAKGEFLMNLGLGLTQAKRGQEFAALGAGAKEGLASYKDAMKDVRATEEKLDDRINSFRLADQQAKKTGTDADIAKRDRQGELVEAAKIKNIEARNAANAEEAKVGANIYGTKMQAETARYVAQLHANTQKEMNTLVKQGQLDAKVAQVLLTSEKNFMDANANSFIGKPDELARAARAHAMEAAKVYLPNSAVANSSMAPAPAPTADIYKNKYGITPTKG